MWECWELAKSSDCLDVQHFYIEYPLVYINGQYKDYHTFWSLSQVHPPASSLELSSPNIPILLL